MTTTETTLSKVYAYFIIKGEQGATLDEACEELNLTQSVIARSRVKLAGMGALYATTEKRRTRAGGRARVHCALPGVNVIKKMGRPSHARSLSRSNRLTVYLTEDEMLKLGDLAENRSVAKSRLAVDLMAHGYTAGTGDQWGSMVEQDNKTESVRPIVGRRVRQHHTQDIQDVTDS